ncbi:MAG TPA: preprotein translocase subunit SecE [Solirubrobacteraceae bacterium]|nr:preprotein translocase subunit SecE [Solirubrobacteraceae bacterium]
MARNRKRRSDRRPHRPAEGARSEPGIATASASRRGEPDDARREEAPDPIEHAAPDVELAEAQLALGRPGVAEELDDDELEVEAAPVPATTAASVPATRPGNRLVHFLQGSWRELQRVQWPDRRQVMQATGVVIGFVIIAGVFLGVADLVANKLVQFLLK